MIHATARPRDSGALLRLAGTQTHRRFRSITRALWQGLVALLPVLLTWATFMALLWVPAVQAQDAGSLPARIAALAADRTTFRMSADSAVAKLQPIVQLRAGKPTDAARSFSGVAPQNGIAWAQVDFQAGNERGRWEFLQMQIGLDSTRTSQPALAAALSTELTRRLGKPKMPSEGKAEHVRLWRLGGGRVVSLREGRFDSPIDGRPRAVSLIELAVEQGEAE